MRPYSNKRTLVLSAFLALPLLMAASCGAPAGPVSEDGALEVGDMTLTSGEYQDSYTVRANEGQWIDVDVRADGFDPYLIIKTPSGTQSDMDDSVQGDTTATTMVLKAQESGEHTIVVTSFAPGETGSYKLRYEVGDTQPAGSVDSGTDDATEPEAEGETVDA